jgi:hypothetical protein
VSALGRALAPTAGALGLRRVAAAAGRLRARQRLRPCAHGGLAPAMQRGGLGLCCAGGVVAGAEAVSG